MTTRQVPQPTLHPAERALLELLLTRWARGKIFGAVKRWEAAGRPDFWPFVADDFGRSVGATTMSTNTEQPQAAAPTHVDSASDGRVVNNTMRHNYRVLDAQEKADMLALKDAGMAFLTLLHQIGGSCPRTESQPAEGARLTSRELSLAGTKVEEAVMWAVKHVTG